MNKSLTILLMLLIGLLSSSCTGKPAISTNSPVQTISPGETSTSVVATNTPPVDKENTPTNVLTITDTPTITPTPTQTPMPLLTRTPTRTPIPTTEAQATIEAFGSLCDDQIGSGISPDGKWIAIGCDGDFYNPDTYLRVISLDRAKDWKIYFGDYVKGSYDHNDMISPYRWSKDGRFLYAVSPSKFSGCCWIGNYGLLVRLNLETGEQVDLLNVVDTRDEIGIPAVNFSISEDDRYLIYRLPLSNQKWVILDLLTWDTQTIEVQFQYSIDANYVLLSPGLDKLIVLLFRFGENDDWFTGDSIGLINMVTGEQKKLASNLETSLYPVRWEDADHVLFSTVPKSGRYDRPSEPEFWLLNIQTAELTKIENP